MRPWVQPQHYLYKNTRKVPDVALLEAVGSWVLEPAHPWAWGWESGGYSPADLERVGDCHFQVLTILSRPWFASVGCLLHMLGGSKPVAMCVV